jgi:hypothetical protein
MRWLPSGICIGRSQIDTEIMRGGGALVAGPALRRPRLAAGKGLVTFSRCSTGARGRGPSTVASLRALGALSEEQTETRVRASDGI